MKKTCAEYKDAARGCLLGNYALAIAASLIIQVASILCSSPFSNMITTGTTYMIPSRIIIGCAGTIIIALLMFVLNAGLTNIHLKIARKEKFSIADLMYGFKNRPDKFMGYGALMILIAVLCMLPLIICMVILTLLFPDGGALVITAAVIIAIICIIILLIVALGLSLTMYLLLDCPEETVISTMKLSFRYMKGNKWRLFKLYFSFIGWLFLGLLTLCIGFLWIEPYLNQSFTQFYLDVTRPTTTYSETV